jgi:XTP/dITP diphosphohydrolase
MSPLRTLLVGSANRDKIAEIEALLDGLTERIASIDELPPGPDVDEDGDTFAANAAKKAVEYARRAALLPSERRPDWVIADDSGLDVDALDGAPGVFSARYAGPAARYADNVEKLLRELADVPDERRGARFVCSIALASVPAEGDEPRVLVAVEGECPGRIGHAPRGSGGFGYDPVFWSSEAGAGMALLPAARKNELSHRARALRGLRPFLEQRVLPLRRAGC